jgi:hypothetical protein
LIDAELLLTCLVYAAEWGCLNEPAMTQRSVVSVAIFVCCLGAAKKPAPQPGGFFQYVFKQIEI